jgi:3'-5' exoribonuclease
MKDYAADIENIVKSISKPGDCVFSVWSDLNGDKRFTQWAGSDHKDKHHYETGGLARHTYEIIQLGFSSMDVLGIRKNIDPVEWFFAALFHDTGKMYDYEPIKVLDVIVGWQPTEHKRLVHHISRSALIWSNIINKYPTLSTKYHDKVLHAILAHHGQREWGSPVAPKTQVAWLLHLCDGISARMDDCNKIDYLSLRAKKS